MTPPTPRSASPADPAQRAKSTPREQYRPERTDLSDLISKISDADEFTAAPPIDEALTDPRDIERPQVAASKIELTGGIDFSPEFASFGSRFVGFFIDTLVTNAMMLPGIVIMVMSGSVTLRLIGGLVAIAGFFVAAQLSARSVAATGRWIGNRVASTTVVTVANGDMLTTSNAWARFVVRGVISPVFLFGFLMALADTQRRSFHDQLAGSIVTRPSRATWSIDNETESSPHGD